MILLLITLLFNVTSAFNYNTTSANATKSNITLTSDFANIKEQFDGKGSFNKTSKFEDLVTDLGDCGKAVIKKYNLSMETGVAFHSISSPQFIGIMNNGTEAEQKAAIIKAMDPFFEKITGFDHDKIV